MLKKERFNNCGMFTDIDICNMLIHESNLIKSESPNEHIKLQLERRMENYISALKDRGYSNEGILKLIKVVSENNER